MGLENKTHTHSQGKVEYKARSILETLYSMRDIKLFHSRERKRDVSTGTYKFPHLLVMVCVEVGWGSFYVYYHSP